MSICEKMFQIMDEKGIKAKELAKELNINQSVISTWKNRGNDPPAKYLIQICKVLKTDIYNLLGYDSKSSDIEEIYDMLSKEDKEIVDIIFNKYRKKEKSSDLKIG